MHIVLREIDSFMSKLGQFQEVEIAMLHGAFLYRTHLLRNEIT